MRIAGITAVAVLSLTRGASAQTVGEILVNDWRDAGKDVLSVWASPFDAKGRDWALFGATLAVTGASMLVDQPVSDWAIRNKDSWGFRAIDPVRRGGVLFSGKYVVPPIAAAYIAGVAFNNQDLRDFVTGCASSWAANSFARKAVYRLVGRARPDTMPDDPHHWAGPGSVKEWQMRSFPAGHFANALVYFIGPLAGGWLTGSYRKGQAADGPVSPIRRQRFAAMYDITSPANAAKLGQTFADANRSAKAGNVIRDIAKAIVGVSEDDGTELAQVGAGSSLLGKFDLKSLLAKKEKGGAKQSEPTE